MAALTEQYVENYFSGLNPLAKKILHEEKRVIQSVGQEGWAKLSEEEQEKILDKYIIGNLHQQEEKDGVSLFPKYNINCGEKIVVDFDNDQGWTWRDEHSAPFSWETRSQQDLPLLDEEDEGLGTEETNKPKKVPKKARSRSPELRTDSPTNFAFKPEKSIWESPFLAADRGLDSGYPSSHTSEQSKGPDEPDDMLNKLGIALSFKSESEPGSPNIVANEETKLLKTPERREERTGSSSRAGSSSRTGSSSSPEPVPVVPTRRSKKPKEAPPPPPPTKKKKEKPQESPRSETIAAASRTEEGGHVSPVFVEEPGESSTDPVIPAQFSFKREPEEASEREARAPAGEVNLAHDSYIEDPTCLDEWETPDVLSKSTDDLSLPKSGFAFLDNW